MFSAMFDEAGLYNIFELTEQASARDVVTNEQFGDDASKLDRAARGLVGMPLVATRNQDYLRPLFSSMDIDQVECSDIDYRKCGDLANPLTYSVPHPDLDESESNNRALICAFNLIDEGVKRQCSNLRSDAQKALAQQDARNSFGTV